VVAATDGVAVADLPIATVDAHFTAAQVRPDGARPVDRLLLGVGVGTAPVPARFDDVPAAVLVGNDVPIIAGQGDLLVR